MKFLVIVRYKDSFYALPQEKKRELAMGAGAALSKYIKNGKLTTFYHFADTKGNVGIFDFESSEDFMRVCSEIPMGPYAELEFIPLVDSEVYGKVMKEVVAAQKTVKNKS
jgi:hypothetical protein